MPYSSNRELPDAVKQKLSTEDQTKWRKVFNSAFSQYDDEQKAFATAWSAVKKHEMRTIQKKAKQRYTLGIVYEPDTEDAHGDFAEASEIEKAQRAFMLSLQGKTGVTKFALDLLGSIVKALDDGEPITLDLTDIYDDVIKAGLNDMHENTDNDDLIGDITDCYIAPTDMYLEGPDGNIERVKKGSWMQGTVWSEDYFKKIESGERTGLSMEGKGRRLTVYA